MKFFSRLIVLLGFCSSLSAYAQVKEGRIKQFNMKASYSIDEILAVKNLTVLYTGNEPQYDGDEYKVIRFQILTVPKHGEAGMFLMQGDTLSTFMKERIKTKMQPGDKILFDDINYSTHQMINKVCNSLAIIIKE